jgi:PKD repeat protein
VQAFKFVLQILLEMNKTLLSIISALAILPVFSQDYFNCGANHQHQQLYTDNPQLEKDYKQLFLNGFQKSNDSTVFVIPVVFHILHQYGNENITDDQVRNQVDILNRDYRLLNNDTSAVIQEFKALYGDVRIEFKLATVDPFGNCTNGIEHIYTHLTNQGDDDSKIHQWYRQNYLNVWVVNSIGSQGVAGYAYYPTAVNNEGFWRDGIIILNNYIGSTGTGNAFRSRALTHEIGHWLGLPHVWGSTNDPGVACGDDGIADTPISKGFNFCPTNTNQAKVCDPTIVENYQNYMEYSYCSVMFTKGQIEAMRSILQGGDGGRKNLITADNHQATGVDLTTPPVCKPIPDFNATSRNTCIGELVTFKDWSYNGPVDSRTWTFQDGSPATSSDANPTVSFNSFGMKTVTLTVSNAAGSETKTFEGYINVTNGFAEVTGPTNFDLESNHVNWFRVENPEENEARFALSSGTGVNGSKSFKLNNYKNVAGAAPYSADYFYYRRLGGSVDALITPAFDLRYSQNVTISFDYAYATNTQSTANMTEKVRVLFSRNCGKTWTPLGQAVTGVDLLTGGFASGYDYKPTQASEWKTITRTFPASGLDENTRFKIEFTASDYSNNFYVDNINVTGTLGMNFDASVAQTLNVAPNPVQSGSELKISYTAENEPVQFILRNLQGEVVMQTERTEQNQLVEFALPIAADLPAACYLLEVNSINFRKVIKLVVVK